MFPTSYWPAFGAAPAPQYRPFPAPLRTAFPPVQVPHAITPTHAIGRGPAAPQSVLYVTAPSGLHLRSRPFDNATLLATLPFGTNAALVSPHATAPTPSAPQGWLLVNVLDGSRRRGFVSAQWVAVHTAFAVPLGDSGGLPIGTTPQLLATPFKISPGLPGGPPLSVSYLPRSAPTGALYTLQSNGVTYQAGQGPLGTYYLPYHGPLAP